MIAALLYSTKECEGPSVCRRDLKTARITGATKQDIIAIAGAVMRGSGDLPIPLGPEFIRVKHQQASGEPVSVELI